MWERSDTVLEVDGLGKLFSRSSRVTRKRLLHLFSSSMFGGSTFSPPEPQAREFWSLKDIKFNLKRGEALGVIGLNGAGKTTLLRILAGQILPDQGEIRILGRTAAMIDLTAGFQMNASGLQNIYLRGAMLGRSSDEIGSALDEIINFSELGDALNAPIATYSSGMLMRLAFSIMVAVKPDVFFVDEVLSVGDFQFRQKCLAKIRELREKTAFVLVSHNMTDIKAFCDYAILLDKGRILSRGNPLDVVETYEKMQTPKLEIDSDKHSKILEPQYHNADAVQDVRTYWCDKYGNRISQISHGETLYFRLRFKIKHKPKKLLLGVPIWTKEGVYVSGFSNEVDGVVLSAEPNQLNEYILEIPELPINPGTYISNVAIRDGVEFMYRGSNPPLEVSRNPKPHWGVISLPHVWKQCRDT